MVTFITRPILQQACQNIRHALSRAFPLLLLIYRGQLILAHKQGLRWRYNLFLPESPCLSWNNRLGWWFYPKRCLVCAKLKQMLGDLCGRGPMRCWLAVSEQKVVVFHLTTVLHYWKAHTLRFDFRPCYHLLAKAVDKIRLEGFTGYIFFRTEIQVFGWLNWGFSPAVTSTMVAPDLYCYHRQGQTYRHISFIDSNKGRYSA